MTIRHTGIVLLGILLGLLLTPTALAADDVRIKSLMWAEDPSAEMGPAEVMEGAVDFLPLPLSQNRHRLGSSDSAFWLKLEVVNDSSTMTRRWLETGQARLREITLYERVNGQWQGEYGGTVVPFSQREVPTLTQVFPLELPPNSSRQFLVRVASDTVIIIHPRLWTTGELMAVENQYTQLEFFMAGAVVLMLLVGVVMMLMLREPGFLVFGLLGFCYLMFRWSIKGIAFREFWPESPEWALQAIGFFWALVALLILVLHRILLRTHELFPRIDRVLIAMIFSFGVFAILYFFLPHRPLMHTMSLWGLTITVLSPVLGYMAWRKGVLLWGYAFAGYVLPWQITQLLYFSSIGWLPPLPGSFTNPAMAGSVVLASVIILAGLGARVVRGQREKAQMKLEEKSRLERLVNERTNELHQSKDIAEQALREHRQFLAMISHELRSPVASIASACSVLESRAEQGIVPSEEVTQRVRRAVGRMTSFLDNLLTEDRFESDGWTINPESIHLANFLNSVIEQARLSVTGHDLVLEASDIPDEVALDPAMTRILLLNLIDNAAKYSPAGTAITLSAAKQDPDHVLLQVVDQGPGLSEEEADHLFKKYARGDHAPGVTGIGMGLYIVRRIVELHGGTIEINAAPAGGTTVSMILPHKA